MQLSEEQALYIHDSQLTDTKLLATAGSGKTFSIIHRINNLLQTNAIQKNNVILLTFSKHAREDFALKIKTHKVSTYDRHNVFTIDSFALKMLSDIAENIDISILSYTFLIYLEQRADQLPKSSQETLKNITDVFVDEAQDLNETQFRIITALKKNYGCRIHLIGDPNQNIYQFRSSSDKYLVNFKARTFYLSSNYRSGKHIVEFCNYLRPYQDVPVKAHNEFDKLKIYFYTPYTYSEFEVKLLYLINRLRNKKVPLHKVAILAPTRGHVSTHTYRGLCYISHILFQHDIPFKQFYSDFSNSDTLEDCSKQNYAPAYNHINLLTMTASKGLEWDYVILIDANAFLISPKYYDDDKYKAEQYLLYVASSRPKKNLMIFTQPRKANPWFGNIPSSLYSLDESTAENFKVFEGDLFNKKDNHEPLHLNISQIVRQLTEEHLFQITEKISFQHSEPQLLRPQEGAWKIKVPSSRSVFMGCIMEHIFYVYLTKTSQDRTPLLKDVNNAVTSTNLIFCSNEFMIRWYYANRQSMTWDIYSQRVNKNEVPKYVQKFIEQHFDKTVDFDAFTLIDKYYDLFIRKNMDAIQRHYVKYIKDPFDLYNLFFVTLVNYALCTSHYFYIAQVDNFYEELITKTCCKEIIPHIETFCHLYSSKENVDIEVQVPLMMEELKGVADIVMNNEVFEIKCSSNIRISDLLQTLLYNILFHQGMDTTVYSLNIINLYDGCYHKYNVTLSKHDKKWLLQLLSSYQK